MRSIHRASRLLPMLLGLLTARGLPPDAVSSWRGWIVFKQFVRIVDEVPDPGVSVQIRPQGNTGDVSLAFLRQVVEPEGEQLRPVGGVVCELLFSEPLLRASHLEFWSSDYSTFERFVDVVEQTPIFAELMVRSPTASSVYWEDA